MLGRLIKTIDRNGVLDMPLTLRLAIRNLFQDRLRFIATLVGIVFSVVLVMAQMGLYLGFGRMVTTMIDHAPADLWIVSRGAKSFDDLSVLDADTQTKALAISGVAHATPVIIGFSIWRLASGEMTPVFVIGSNLGDRDLQPWNLVAGKVADLAAPEAIAVDRSYFELLGISGIGSIAEIRGQKVRVAAVTDGIRSFATMPYIFSGLDRARSYLTLSPDTISHLLIQVERGGDIDRIRRELKSNISDIDVLTSNEFRDRSRSFWLFGTGAGAALFSGALLSLIVGTVIVAQTLYSSTKDHLSEFATLRAIGCSNRYIYKVIRYQALLNAVAGFCIATVVGAGMVRMTAKSPLPVVLTPELVIGLFILTVVMCIAAATVAIARVVRIDPVTVLTR
jgi:putative ABC transport system permease protein